MFPRIGAITLFVFLAWPGSAAADESYDYDVNGRLVRVTYDDGSFIEYAYDDAGNLVYVERNDDGSPNQAPDSTIDHLRHLGLE